MVVGRLISVPLKTLEIFAEYSFFRFIYNIVLYYHMKDKSLGGYLIGFVLIYILSNLSFLLWNIQYRVAFDKHVIKYVTTGSVLLCTKALSNCTVADYTVCTKPQKTKCSWLNCTVLCICWNKLYTVLHIKFTFY